MAAWVQPVYGTKSLLITLGLNKDPDLPGSSAYRLEPPIPTDGWPALLRPPISQTITRWYRNINLFSIAYAFRPRLRDRLTLSRLALLRKPWALRRAGFSPALSLLMSAWSLPFSPQSSRSDLQPATRLSSHNAPLPISRSRRITSIRSFGTTLEPRYIFGADPLDQ